MFVDAPNLKEISLAGNCILHPEKAVNKMMFPQLRRLELSQNVFKKLRVERWKVSMDGIYVTLFTYEGVVAVEDLSFFAPLHCRFPLTAQ